MMSSIVLCTEIFKPQMPSCFLQPVIVCVVESYLEWTIIYSRDITRSNGEEESHFLVDFYRTKGVAPLWSFERMQF